MHRSGVGAMWLIAILVVVLLPFGASANPAASKVLEYQRGKSNSLSTDQDMAETDLRADAASIEAYMATLSDEQVRRLLIEELKKDAAMRLSADEMPEVTGRLKGFIQGTKQGISRFKTRLGALRLGQPLQWDKEPNLFNYLSQDAPGGRAGPAIFQVTLLFSAGLLLQWFFRRYTASARVRIETARPESMWSRLAGLSMRAVLELAGLLVFVVVVLAGYGLFLRHTSSQSVLMSTYLAAIVIIQAVFIVLQFLLSPGRRVLRVFPLGDDLAVYLYYWMGAIAIVASFGFLTCGLFHVAGTSEGLHMSMVGVVSLVLTLMVAAMILNKRKQVAQALCTNLAPEGVTHRIAANWHHFAIFLVFLAYVSGMVLAIMGSTMRHPGLKTVIAIALYFPVDWTLRRMLGGLIHLVSPDGHGDDGEHAHTAHETGATGDDEEESEAATAYIGSVKVHRMQHVILTGLRAALGALFFVWILSFWGIELPYARIAARAIFNILIVVCLCYVAWELLSSAIQKRLEAEMPDTDEEMEEGGAGGSRLGTLLLLLRKFVFTIIVIMASLIILSTIGVNIGPLIAGAGVLGLAIGFGAQTLVKDIISGLFFLIDDAFRVGDYVDVGGVLGTVERISIRSMSLRHPRGMVHTMPFGDISNVTNYSRDYIITKLDFRVRYDTDVEKVRKVIKKRVYKPILANEELAPKLLGKIKSQGVRQLDDSAMIMRVKYKSIPGEQFVIRKEVYRLMKEAFQNEGIEFAHRNVTVYLPNEENRAKRGQATAEAAAQAGAAALAEESKGG